MGKKNEISIELSQLKSHIQGLQLQFLDQIPFDAWRFFTPCRDEIQFMEGEISFNQADFFDVNGKDFRDCLEFWAKQAGGTIKWDKAKK